MIRRTATTTCVLWAALACSSSQDASNGTAGALASMAGGNATTTGAMATSTGSPSVAGTSGTSSSAGSTAAGGNTTMGTPSSGGSAQSTAQTGGTTSDGGNAAGGGGGGGGNTSSPGGASSSGGASPTSACGNTSSATGTQERSMDVGGTARTYLLSVPDDYDGASAMPLVFAWHGLGGSGTLASRYFGVERASGGEAIFVYPDGLPNDDGDPGWDLDAAGIDIQFFDSLLDAVSAEYCVDSSRVFSTGHSFGGFFTNRLACTRGDLLRGIAPVAGGPPFGGAGGCDVVVAAWIAHGSNDETVAFEQGERTRDLWSTNAGCGTTSAATAPDPCVALDGCSAEAPVHWCVHEDGHDWPSFAGDGVWAFFAAL